MIVFFTALALVQSTPSQADASAVGRAFLEAFAADVSAARRLATRDAMIVVGDIGGPYADYAKVFQSAGSWLKSCKVASVTEKPAPTADQLSNAEPRYAGGRISILDGAYQCTGPDGSPKKVDVRLVVKDALVTDVYFQGSPR